MSIKASSGLVMGSLLFGLGSLIVAFVPLGAYALVFWRLLVSSLLFGAWLLLKGRPKSIPKQIVFLLMFSGAALALDLALWHESIRTVGPSISTLLNGLQVFFLALIGYAYFGETQSIGKLSSLVLAMAGVALIASPKISQNLQAFVGFATGILSGFALAVSMTLLKEAQKRHPLDLVVAMTLIGIGGVIFIAPFAYLIDNGRLLPNTSTSIVAVLVYGAVMQCLAWGMIAYAIPRLSLTATGLLLLCEPIAALLIDAFWLGKHIDVWQFVGAIITLVAIFLGSIQKNMTAS